MKITSYAVARPAYYDRGATSFSGGYDAVLAPHADTNRVSVTVAAGQKVILEGVNMSTQRVTVATVIQVVGFYSNVTSTAGFRITDISTNNNLANIRERQFVATNVTIYVGETFTANTVDTSTGGSVYYIIQYKGTTFSA